MADDDRSSRAMNHALARAHNPNNWKGNQFHNSQRNISHEQHFNPPDRNDQALKFQYMGTMSMAHPYGWMQAQARKQKQTFMNGSA
jgi:hypothetical protein